VCTTRAVALAADSSLCPSLWIPSGGWGRRRTPCCRVADVAADGGGVSKAAFIERALQKMSVTSCEANARVLRTFRELLKPVAART
jgi:hypothetical protein